MTETNGALPAIQRQHLLTLEKFRKLLSAHQQSAALEKRWKHPERKLRLNEYLSLFLFGLLNPTLRTMRGLCWGTEFEKARQEIGCGQVSLACFSDAQHLVEESFLEKIFEEALKCHSPLGNSHGSPSWTQWFIQDSSLFAALPRMHWALYGGGRKDAANRAVRLHVSLNLLDERPNTVAVTEGKICERKVWRSQWKRGQAYVGDRYFSEDYSLLDDLCDQGCRFVLRMRDEALWGQEELLPMSAEDRAQGVVYDAQVRLGSDSRYYTAHKIRIVCVSTPHGELRLVTNVPVEELSAREIALLYRRRWQVECFFSWLKCLLGCRHWLAESRSGVKVQLYLALIAAVLVQDTVGHRPSKRCWEALQLYMMGWVKDEELDRVLAKEAARKARAKKNR